MSEGAKASANEAPRGSPRNLYAAKVAFALLAVAFAINAYYVYAVRFAHFIHADAAVTALLGAKVVHSGSPVVRDWYYANGDVWVFAPHIFAVPTVALFGLCPQSLLAAVVLGLGLELAALVWAYRRLAQGGWVAWFAAIATLAAWSRAHVLFVYVELAYGFVSTMYILLFALFAPLLAEKPRRWAGAFAIALMFVISLQNPMRAFIFVAAPLMGCCLWPWNGFPWKARVRFSLHAIGGWALALFVYRMVFTRLLSFSPQAGHVEFVIKDAAGIWENVKMLGQGLVAITGGPDEYGLSMVPGLVLLAGAIAFVLAFAFRSRQLTPMRFFTIVVLAQGALVIAPMLLGNLMLNPLSARYLLPAFLPIFGIATICAKDTLSSARWPRFLALGWLALMPAVATLVFFRTFGASLERNGQWANREAHVDVANALVAHDLKHGFATYWNANLLTLLSSGKTKTCGVSFGGAGLMPRKWVTDTECYDASTLPPRFYVLSAPEEREQARRSMTASLHEPTERFLVGDGFEVSVFETKDVRMDWLLLPLPDGNDLRLPLRLPVTHPQLQRDASHSISVMEGNELVATGDGGTVVYGPYLHMPAGDYRVRWIGRGIASEGQIAFDVVSGPATFAHQGFPATELPREHDAELAHFDFTIDKPTAGVEFRVFSGGGGRVALTALALERR